MTITKHFPWPPKYVLHEFLFKSHEKQSNGKTWKRGFCALSKLVYFETQLLELVESSMKVPIWSDKARSGKVTSRKVILGLVGFG